MIRFAAGVAFFFASVVAPAAVAQSPAPTNARLDITFAAQHFGPGSPLQFVLHVRSARAPLADLRASIALYERVRSRTELDAALLGDLPTTPLEAFTIPLPDVSTGEGRSADVSQPFESLAAFQDAPDGLYPMSVTVRTSTGPALDSAVTAVALLNGPPRVPLGISAVVSLIGPPVVGPSGPDVENLRTMARTVRALPAAGPELGVAVPGSLLEALDVADDPDAAAIRRSLGAAAGSLLATPHTGTALADLERLGAGTVRESFATGSATVARRLQAEPRAAAVPPGLAVDERTARDVAAAGMDSMFVPGEVVADSAITPARPAEWEGMTLVPVDVALSTVATRARNGLEQSHALAQSAMVFFERPGTVRTLGLVLGWDAVRAASILEGLRDAPWVNLQPVPVAAEDEVDPRWPEPTELPGSVRRAVRDARESAEEVAAYTLEGDAFARRLTASVDAAAATAGWDGRWQAAREYARSIRRAAADHAEKIVARARPVTFTSRQGEIPITIANRTEEAVRLRIEVSSPKLAFPDGATRILPRLAPPGTTITVPATAEATGTFPLTVVVTSPDGSVVVASDELLVRSTAANLLALALTVGAALFLVLWYGRRFWERRR